MSSHYKRHSFNHKQGHSLLYLTFMTFFNTRIEPFHIDQNQEVEWHTVIHSNFGTVTQESPLYTTLMLPEAAPDQALRPKLR